MYSIQVRVNHRLLTLDQDQRGSVGIIMRGGDIEYFYWGGFTLHTLRRVKLKVAAVTNEQLPQPASGLPATTALDVSGCQRVSFRLIRRGACLRRDPVHYFEKRCLT